MNTEKDKQMMESLIQDVEQTKLYFKWNREKAFKDYEELEKEFKEEIELMEKEGPSLHTGVYKLLITHILKTLKGFSDTTDFLEIMVNQTQQFNSKILELSEIMRSSGEEQRNLLDGFNDKLRKQEKEVSDLSKNKESMEWLTRFFKKETTSIE